MASILKRKRLLLVSMFFYWFAVLSSTSTYFLKQAAKFIFNFVTQGQREYLVLSNIVFRFYWFEG